MRRILVLIASVGFAGSALGQGKVYPAAPLKFYPSLLETVGPIGVHVLDTFESEKDLDKWDGYPMERTHLKYRGVDVLAVQACPTSGRVAYDYFFYVRLAGKWRLIAEEPFMPWDPPQVKGWPALSIRGEELVVSVGSSVVETISLVGLGRAGIDLGWDVIAGDSGK